MAIRAGPEQELMKILKYEEGVLESQPASRGQTSPRTTTERRGCQLSTS